MESDRYLNYFIVNGKKYYTGTVFIMKEWNAKPVEAVFICYDAKYGKYRYNYKNRVVYAALDAKTFSQWFVCVTGEVDGRTRMPQVKCLPDSLVPGLPVGWLWYIVLMLFGVVVKSRVLWWVFISIVFFNWRNKKKQKEGTCVEW